MDKNTIATAAGEQAESSQAFPERDPSKPAEQQGIFHKFDIRRVDGSDQPGGKHYGCRYFVLDLTHDEHAPAAMRAYAAACSATHPQLASDIEAEFGAAPATPEQVQAPIAYLHQVVCGDGEPDQALSFEPDNFPLAGTLGYRSISHQALYLAAPIAAAPAAPEQDEVRNQALEDAEEAVEILESFITNVSRRGPYSAEATLTFIGQAKQCVDGAIRAMKTATNEVESQDEVRDRVRDAVAQALTCVYVCTRSWSAWGYGTMSQDDFAPAGEDDDVLDNIVDAALGAMKTTINAGGAQ